ncbi:unnamed protein product [Lathyrus oleraceus]
MIRSSIASNRNSDKIPPRVNHLPPPCKAAGNRNLRQASRRRDLLFRRCTFPDGRRHSKSHSPPRTPFSVSTRPAHSHSSNSAFVLCVMVFFSNCLVTVC